MIRHICRLLSFRGKGAAWGGWGCRWMEDGGVMAQWLFFKPNQKGKCECVCVCVCERGRPVFVLMCVSAHFRPVREQIISQSSSSILLYVLILWAGCDCFKCVLTFKKNSTIRNRPAGGFSVSQPCFFGSVTLWKTRVSFALKDKLCHGWKQWMRLFLRAKVWFPSNDLKTSVL